MINECLSCSVQSIVLGSIDEVREEATMTWVQPRVLNKEQVSVLSHYFVPQLWNTHTRLHYVTLAIDIPLTDCTSYITWGGGVKG